MTEDTNQKFRSTMDRIRIQLRSNYREVLTRSEYPAELVVERHSEALTRSQAENILSLWGARYTDIDPGPKLVSRLYELAAPYRASEVMHKAVALMRDYPNVIGYPPPIENIVRGLTPVVIQSEQRQTDNS